MSFFTASDPAQAVEEASLADLTSWLFAEGFEFDNSPEEVRAAALAHIMARRQTVFQVLDPEQPLSTSRQVIKRSPHPRPVPKI